MRVSLRMAHSGQMPRLPYLAIGSLALWMCVACAVGVVRNYSAVPFWDVWDGVIGFYQRILSGDVSAWFYQHNEHRLVVPRLFFFVDMHFLDGRGSFLLLAQFLAQALSAFLISRLTWKSWPNEKRFLVGSLILAAMFNWSQKENFTWSFQVQFVMVYTFAIAAFLLFSSSAEAGKARAWKDCGGALCALAAAGCMANGLFVLPLCAAYVLLGFRRRRLALLLIILACAVWGAYLFNYANPPEHASPLQSLLHHPVKILIYLSKYLGSPFLFLPESLVFWIGAAGLLGLPGLVTATVVWDKGLRDRVFESALLWLAAFLVLTALVTALGRINFGTEQALSSRYSTPATIYWIAMLVWVFENVSWRSARRVCAVSVALMLAALAFAQKAALTEPVPVFERRLAALSLALAAGDEAVQARIYPYHDRLLETSRFAIANRLSVFSETWLSGAISRQGYALPVKIDRQCRGAFEKISRIGIDRFRASGWVLPEPNVETDVVWIVDEQMRVLGAGVWGERRPDVKRARPASSAFSGWRAYVVGTGRGKLSAIMLGKDSGACLIGGPNPFPAD